MHGQQCHKLLGRPCTKSWKHLIVIPAKADHVRLRGKSIFFIQLKGWIAFFKGMTTFCRNVL
jgi:hypothetical protein